MNTQNNYNMNNKYLFVIMLLIIIIMMQLCTTRNRSVKNVSKQIDSIAIELHNIHEYMNKLPDYTDLRIEGLKSELRSIQASDRKILDVNRQKEIQREIDSLMKLKYKNEKK